MTALKIINVVGCRPNFMKVAPLMVEMRHYPEIRPLLVHTGQHYNRSLSEVFFRELQLPEPDLFLNVGSGSHAQQTAAVMERFEDVLLAEVPDLVIVVGDVNSTLGAALTAVKSGFPVAHVEAGLRSFDREMPEEINRVLTDAVAELLFATERSAVRNLLRQGIARERIFFVGNVMVDTLLMNAKAIDERTILSALGLEHKQYVVLTVHRPCNVDDRPSFEQVIQAVERLQRHVLIVFPVHPRTMQRAQQLGLSSRLGAGSNLRLIEPLGYLDFIKLVKESRLMITDSGGVQEECTVLGIPCLTLRETTERPVTVEMGANLLTGHSPDRVVAEALRILRSEPRRWHIPEKWDGHASRRIVRILLQKGDHLKRLARPVRERLLCNRVPTTAA